MKKGLLIGAVVVVVLGILVAVYFVFFSKPPSLSVDETPNPFGEAPDTPPTTSDDSNDPFALGQAGQTIAPRFIKITDGPVARGSVVFQTAFVNEQVSVEASTTLESVPEKDYTVRYVERATGNVYSYLVNKRTLSRISNRTVPGVQEASWLSDGSLVYVRYLTELGGGREQIETYALPIGTEGGYFLEKDLVQVLAKSVDTVLTLLPSSSGALGSLVHADGTAMEAAFTSPLSAITAQFAGDDFVATTKASASVDGYAFLIDGTSSTFTRILGPLRGLSVLASPSGKSLLYSYINRGAVSVALFDVETRASIPLPISTLTEKCVWTTDEQAVYCSVPRALSGVLPDTWYQGAFSFSDKLWKVDLVERVAILMIDPLIVGEVNIDGVALALDEGANVLVFTDKRSGALYLYDL